MSDIPPIFYNPLHPLSSIWGNYGLWRPFSESRSKSGRVEKIEREIRRNLNGQEHKEGPG